jgi:IS5 family transposase
LSLTVTGANRHDVTQLGKVLAIQQLWFPPPLVRRSKHLCADAGYRGAPAEAMMVRAGYIPHVQSRAREARQRQRHPHKRAHRWIVEVAHSWFNRFRKLLVRYEKLERSFLALHHLAAAIIVFRKVPMTVNIIYG